MGKTEACCDCAAIHDDVLEHVQEHIVPEDQRQSMAKLFKIFGGGIELPRNVCM